MISRREARMDRTILKELRDPMYIAQRRQAWRMCLILAGRQEETTRQERYDYWTPAWERKMVAEAEAEGARARERRLALEHAAQLAELRKPVQRESLRKPAIAEKSSTAEKIRRVK